MMKQYEKWLAVANNSILASIGGLVLTILVAYPLANAFSLGIQVMAHIGTLFFAVGVKVSYVARLTFLSKLGRPVH
ncbi:hypothetical protein [Marinobacter sp. AL4B]|uniref:hypothetical protein n=1 Tax=Marinobacter sp. AL4B TaxID=2871173 RepID=UPI0021CDAA4F|nr:hypothetical protein [Marinobacter sp. AL4B]